MDEKKKQASGPVKWILIGISAIFLFVMLVLPLVVVVTQALSKGWQCYVQACGMGNDQISFSGKKTPYHFDRCSGYGITGYRRSYLYPGFWKAESSLFCS